MNRSLIVTFSALFILTALIISLGLIVENVAPVRVSPPSGPEVVLEALNRRNSAAHSVYCPRIRAGFTSNSLLFYDKNDNILFSTWFLDIREALVGCDGSEYWFWIRSFDRKSLYFCDRSKLDSTILKPIMRPEVIGMIAWITEVSPEQIARSEKGFIARAKGTSMEILVEFDHEKILSQAAFLGDRRIVTLEGEDFAEFSGVLMPRKIRATWHEENLSGDFFVPKWVINAKNPGMHPPEGLKRINLEDYSSSSKISVSFSSAQAPDGL